MNRLVIVGNGFDLAHGLPTGYCDFIDWYWGKVIDNIELPTYEGIPSNCEYGFVNIQFQFDADYYELIKIRNEFVGIKRVAQLNEIIQKYQISDAEKVLIEANHNRNINNCRLTISNHFFKTINDKKNIQNWIDIENEYYQLLIDCLKEKNNDKVKKLNEEFEQVKNLLEQYLYSKIDQGFDFNICNDATELLRHFLITPRHLSRNDDNPYLKEFPKVDHPKLIEFDDEVIHANKENTLEDYINYNNMERNLFLNFNYTSTLSYYLSIFRLSSRRNIFANSQEIQIHGQLNNEHNPINFGFGDEMDSHYKLIEEKDDNEYLKNIKSFQYLQNSNYKDLLDFIDSEKFQVYIMGHSCGLSDRILLNTIFEHEHCRSIKVFYHEKDGKDNYTDIVQNISRHFNKKKMMRDKLVNKSLCQPLPQNIRFAPKQ